MRGHHKINDGLRIEATYVKRDRHGCFFLQDLKGDVKRDHAWLHSEMANFPEGIQPGSKIRFYASFFPRPGGARLTDIRELEVLS